MTEREETVEAESAQARLRASEAAESMSARERRSDAALAEAEALQRDAQALAANAAEVEAAVQSQTEAAMRVYNEVRILCT